MFQKKKAKDIKINSNKCCIVLKSLPDSFFECQFESAAGVFNKWEDAPTGAMRGSLHKKAEKRIHIPLVSNKRILNTKLPDKMASSAKCSPKKSCSRPCSPCLSPWINKMFIKKTAQEDKDTHAYRSEQVSFERKNKKSSHSPDLLEIQPSSQHIEVAKNEYEHLLRILSKQNTPYVFPNMPKSAIYQSGKVKHRNRLPQFAYVIAGDIGYFKDKKECRGLEPSGTQIASLNLLTSADSKKQFRQHLHS